jgi:parallel beta-helix repeat protein
MLLVFSVFISTGFSATYYVPGDYSTIQEAIDSCVDGDTIIVKPGTYYESVDYDNKLLTIKSEQGAAVTTIDGMGEWSVVSFGDYDSADSVLQGFTIQNSSNIGVGCWHGSPTITQNIINNCGYAGINVGDEGTPTITENTISGVSGSAIQMYSYNYDQGHSITISQNNLSNCFGDGIYIDQLSGYVPLTLTINNNTITGNDGNGIIVWYLSSTDVIIDDNIITDNDDSGIQCYSSYDANIDIMNNTISQNGEHGIDCSSGYDNLIDITENIIDMNESSGINAGAYYNYYLEYLTINNNTITNHSNGGIICNRASVHIYENIITNNTSSGQAGGIGAYECDGKIENNEISDNIGGECGGIECSSEFYDRQTLTIQGNSITNNSGDWAGGISCDEYAEPVIAFNVIKGNIATYTGGGIACSDESSPAIWNCLIVENEAGFSGGGISCDWASSPDIGNCTIANNSVDYSGGGLWVMGFCQPNVIDCIFWNNSASVGKEIWIGDSTFAANLTIGYSDVEGGQASVFVCPGCQLDWGAGMIDSDPLFWTGPEGNYYLGQDPCQPGLSNPCVDAGSETAAALGMDLYWTRTDEVADSGQVDMGYHHGNFTSGSENLTADVTEISASAGVVANFSLNAGASYAGRKYLLVATLSGTSPGTLLPGGLATLPINWDILSDLTVQYANTPMFHQFLAVLDGAGTASAQFNTFGPIDGSLVGYTMSFAYALGPPPVWDFASIPVDLNIVP